MRNVINKGLTEEDILTGAGEAFEGGWNKVKLYFMLGLPTETEEDMRDIAVLADKVARRYYEIPKEKRNGKCQITASSSFFDPQALHPLPVGPDVPATRSTFRGGCREACLQEQLEPEEPQIQLA